MKKICLLTFFVCNFLFGSDDFEGIDNKKKTFITNSFFESSMAIAVNSAEKGFCASISVVPPFWFLMKKSAIQTGSGIPNYSTAFMCGIRAIPNTAATVGTQIFFESEARNYFEQNGIAGAKLDLFSCGVGALASSPMYAIMNLQTMNTEFFSAARQAFRDPLALSIIFCREIYFLGTLSVSQKITDCVQNKLGKNRFIENSSYFLIGSSGALLGHPFDTVLTLRQKNIRFPVFSEPGKFCGVLMRGGFNKAVGVGLFNVLYQNFTV